MTESEARTILKAEIVHHSECSIFAEALGIAIKALEKQIPKKKDSYSCPVCSNYFEDGEDFNYCPECGQRWE